MRYFVFYYYCASFFLKQNIPKRFFPLPFNQSLWNLYCMPLWVVYFSHKKICYTFLEINKKSKKTYLDHIRRTPHRTPFSWFLSPAWRWGHVSCFSSWDQTIQVICLTWGLSNRTWSTNSMKWENKNWSNVDQYSWLFHIHPSVPASSLLKSGYHVARISFLENQPDLYLPATFAWYAGTRRLIMVGSIAGISCSYQAHFFVFRVCWFLDCCFSRWSWNSKEKQRKHSLF